MDPANFPAGTAGSDQATDVEFCRCQAQQMTLARYDVARERAVLNLNEENMGRYGKPDVIYSSLYFYVQVYIYIYMYINM